nr:transposase [Candidatus Limiplasma sp.]
SPQKYGFHYLPDEDCFICPTGKRLEYHRLNCNKSTGKYLRCYQVQDDSCLSCERRNICFDKAGVRRKILASGCYPAFHRGHERIGSEEYYTMMRKRKIWSEGSFSVLKREHLMSKIRKRGLLCATEECLLAAMALNLKRMVKAILYSIFTRLHGRHYFCFV